MPGFVKFIVGRCLKPFRRWACARNLGKFRWCVSMVGDLVDGPLLIKIGANDEITGDPCSDLLRAGRLWFGVLVEPVPFCCERLQENSSDTDRFTVVEAAIDYEDGERDLFFLSPEAKLANPDLPDWFDQLGSFDPLHIERQFGPRIRPHINCRRVAVQSYAALLAEHCQRPYWLLHIDTEGYDLEVLKMALGNKPLPKMNFVEHAHVGRTGRQEMRKRLRASGYAVRDCGMNYFGIRRGRLDELAQRRSLQNGR